MPKTRLLKNQDIHQLIHEVGINQLMDLLIERLDVVIQNYNPSTTRIPVRSGFNYTEPHSGLVEWMPIYTTGSNVVIKLVGYHPENPEVYQLPTIASTISAYDTTTGHLIGLMDGVLPTALRTGAASALASKYLAKPNSQVLGLIGCGAQAVTQLHALSRLFTLKKVLIYDVDFPTQENFLGRVADLSMDCQVEFASISEIMEKSDIVCTQTSIGIGEGPLFENEKTQAHVHINAVGSDFPGKVELPVSFLKEAFVCPDFLEQAIQEGECQQLLKGYIGCELEKVVKYPGKYESYQQSKSVFDSTGWALEDMVVFNLLMDLASKHGIGEDVSIEYIPEDAKNPYEFLSIGVKAN